MKQRQQKEEMREEKVPETKSPEVVKFQSTQHTKWGKTNPTPR